MDLFHKARCIDSRLLTGLRIPICNFMTTANLERKTPWEKKGPFKTFEGYKANLPLKEKSKEIKEAHKLRVPYDYPLGVDQKATWNHSRWYDHYYDKWVRTIPKPSRKNFDVDVKEMRTLIHEQQSIEHKFALLLDKAYKRKYIIKTFDLEFPENVSFYYQYLTNTKFVHGVPHTIQSMDIDEEDLQSFEEFLTNLLRLEFHCSSETRKERADGILKGIVQYLVDYASASPDFYDCEVDRDPENSMFWQRGRGFHKWNMPDDCPVYMQTHDSPLYQIRTKKTLTEFTPWMEDFMLTGEIPCTDFTPHVYDIHRRQYRNTITPGIRFKAGDIELNYQDALDEELMHKLPPPLHDACTYGHTQFISLPEEFDREWYQHNLYHCDITDQLEEHLKAHGMMSGWTWSAAQAHYNGHWMDDDVEKPICVQSVITDGQYISFFCYQLNTVAIDPENAASNPRRNICYGTPMMQLYNRVEGTDDIELYRDTVTLLLKFISNGSHVNIDKEKAIEHNASLEVQEWNNERPTIEDQKPKHVRDKEAAIEAAKTLEVQRNRGMKHKFLDLLMK